VSRTILILVGLALLVAGPAPAAKQKREVTPHFHFQVLILEAPAEVREALEATLSWEDARAAVLEDKARLRFAGSTLLAEHRYAQFSNGVFQMLDIRIQEVKKTGQYEVTPYLAYKDSRSKYRALVKPGEVAVLFETVLEDEGESEELIALVRILAV